MVAFTLKNIPNSVHKYFKRQAKFHHRSLNSEFMAYLEKAPGKQQVNVEEEIKRVRALRKKLKIFITDKDINKAKSWGRP